MPFPNIDRIEVTKGGAVTVLDRSIPTIVAPAKPRVIEVIQRGLPGASGSGTAKRFTHTQNPAAAKWTVPHNLGDYPQTDILSVGGVKIGGAVTHSTVNLLYVDFAQPQAGKVICDVNASS